MPTPSDDHPYDGLRDEFTDADTRFREAMGSAFTEHTKCVALFRATMTQVGRREASLQKSVADLQESVDELKRLLLGGA